MTNVTYLWHVLLTNIGNEYGVAGLMGNLQAESGLHPDRVQGDIPYSQYSRDYTARVDSGQISENAFVYNGPNGGGYGLAQWTYPTRKRGLYQLYRNGNYPSIGNIDLAIHYLLYELQTSYTGVLNVLENADSIREASDAVLMRYERPADQSTRVQIIRAQMGQEIYQVYSGSTPNANIPPYEETDDGRNAETERKRKFNFIIFRKKVDTWKNQN